jgi:hypothetical protein
MKRFSQFKLKIELILLFAVGVILLLDYAFQAYYSVLHVQAQLQQQQSSPIIGIKITSPVADQQLPVGELTISGISTDNSTADCTVYADWNNLKPFQTATATGPGGVNDYSTWNFTYTPQYHIITNGTNNLTSKLSCVDDSNGGTTNLTKNYSIDVIGIATTRAAAISTQGEVQKQQQSSAIDNNNSLIKGISNIDNNNATLDNETKVVVEEEIPTGNNNISKPSIPMPIVAESYLNPNMVNVNITSLVAGQQVPAGNLTVTGISSDNSTTDCQIWLGWNEQKPFQTATATGPGGVNDYSTWNFTYTPQYHIITNGTNNLAAQISCFNSNTLANITKSYSVNVTGIIESSEQSALAAQNISSSLPSVKIDNDDDNRTTTTTPPPQIIPSVPTTSPLPLQPSIKDDEEKEQTEEEPEPESESEPEPESEPQPTTSLTEDDKTEEDTDEEENPSEQGKEVEEVQEEEEVQEQLQQILEKVGKVEQEVQQKVGKIEEDILEEIENGLR